MRPPRTAAALALALAMLAGCGGSDSDGATPGPRPEEVPNGSTATPGTPNGGSTGVVNPRPSAAASASASAKPAGTDAAALRKATLLADSGVLRAADLPGFTAEPQSLDGSDDLAEENLYTCLRAPRPTFVARNPGSVWTRAAERIFSSADVVASAKAAKQDIIAAKSGVAPNCFLEHLFGVVGGPGSSTSGRADGVPATVKGADSAFAVKVTITLTDAKGTTELNGYLVGAAVGAVRISVLNLVTGDNEARLAYATELAGKAAARVRAASQG